MHQGRGVLAGPLALAPVHTVGILYHANRPGILLVRSLSTLCPKERYELDGSLEERVRSWVLPGFTTLLSHYECMLRLC